MDVSFIIVNYNSTALAISCIHSIQTYTRDIAYEILVVDNASPDDDANLLLTRFPNIQVCKLAENRGFGAANNLALAQAKGAFVFFLNPDTELTHNAARQFADYLQKPEHKHIAICGAHLFNESPQGTPSYGNFPGFWQSLASAGPYLLFRSYYYQHLDTGVVNKLDQTREVDYVSGAAMFIRRSIIQQVNGFDEHFFLYFEETDLCKRVNNAGYKTMLIPSIKIRHKEGGSTAKGFNAFGFYHFQKSRRYYYKKHLGILYPYLVAPFDLVHLLLKSFTVNRYGSRWLQIKIFFGYHPQQYLSVR